MNTPELHYRPHTPEQEAELVVRGRLCARGLEWMLSKFIDIPVRDPVFTAAMRSVGGQ